MTIKPNCDCFKIFDEKLACENLKLKAICITNFTNNELIWLPILQTEKIDNSIRKTKPKTIVPSFCPFYGKKYLEQNNRQAEERSQ